jgi:fibulin 1/2
MSGNVSQQQTASLIPGQTTSTSAQATFKWTPTNLNPVDVSFIAVDSNGAISATMRVVLTICSGCGGHGTCQFNSSIPINNGTAYRLAGCSCALGWMGLNCTVDYQGCASNPCGASNTAACTNLTPAQQSATGLSYTCSSCPQGYGTNQCIDINECAANTNLCTQTCINTPGSYLCQCQPGFVLAADGYTCQDINECALGTDTCTQVCTNTVGSYVCNCYPGYAGPPVCNPVVPCNATNSCQALCAVINGQQTCSCDLGSILAADGFTCNLINQCSSTMLNKCSSPTLCAPNVGSAGYTCGCPAGSTLGPDLRTCQVCPAGTWGENCARQCNCGPHVISCSPATGCSVCQAGWDGDNCAIDVNECGDGTATCPVDTTCVNMNGTYYCACNSGGSTTDCVVVTTTTPASSIRDACVSYPTCQNGGTCGLNANQRPYCSCVSGYTGSYCDIVASQVSSSARNVGLIAGVTTAAVIVLLITFAVIFYFVILPRITRKRKVLSEGESSNDSVMYHQAPTRFNQYWPTGAPAPPRYTPQTYEEST